MSVPEIVRATLDGEEVDARVDLGGEDELFVTKTRTILYRADGLLSDESVEEYPHDAERVSVSAGRRKGSITLQYPGDVRNIKIPAKRLDEALTPILGGVLAAASVIDEEESVARVYRFSELTFAITDRRVIKHVGQAVWDEEFEAYHFDDVTRLGFESGNVATQIVIEVDGRPQRIKAPNEYARDIQSVLEETLFAYHDVDSMTAFEAAVGTDDESDPETDTRGPTETALSGGLKPLGAKTTLLGTPDEEEDGQGEDDEAVEPDGERDNSKDETIDSGNEAIDSENEAIESDDEDVESDDEEVATDDDTETNAGEGGTEGFTAGFESAADKKLERQVEELTEMVSRQNAMLERHEQTLQQLIEELRRGR